MFSISSPGLVVGLKLPPSPLLIGPNSISSLFCKIDFLNKKFRPKVVPRIIIYPNVDSFLKHRLQSYPMNITSQVVKPPNPVFALNFTTYAFHEKNFQNKVVKTSMHGVFSFQLRPHTELSVER